MNAARAKHARAQPSRSTRLLPVHLSHAHTFCLAIGAFPSSSVQVQNFKTKAFSLKILTDTHSPRARSPFCAFRFFPVRSMRSFLKLATGVKLSASRTLLCFLFQTLTHRQKFLRCLIAQKMRKKCNFRNVFAVIKKSKYAV